MNIARYKLSKKCNLQTDNIFDSEVLLNKSYLRTALMRYTASPVINKNTISIII